MNDIHTLGKAMRDAQRAYFKDRSQENLIASKQAEAAFDKALAAPPALASDDGTCVRCGAAPRNASGLCATCLDEDAEREGEIPPSAPPAKPAALDAGAHTTLRSANIARQAEWDAFNQLTLAYRGNELAGEVGEACNIIKKLERERMGIAGSRSSVEQLAEELADVVICTDLIAMQAGIDLDAAVIAKFNASSEKVGLKTRLASIAGEIAAKEPAP